MKKLSLRLVVIFSFLSVLPNALAEQINFTPRTSVTEEYNDNIYLDRKNPEDDFITTVSAGFTAEVAGQTRLLTVSYDPSYLFYAENSDNDGFEHRASLSFQNEFGRNTTFELNNFFLYARDPLADRDVEDDAGNIIVTGDDTRRDTQNKYWRNAGSTRLSHRFGAEDLAFAQFSYNVLENDDPTEEDSQELRPSVGLIYWWNVNSGLEFNSGYTKGLFDGDSSSDFDQVDGSFRLNRRISRRLGLFGEYQHVYRDYDTSGINTSGLDQNDYMLYAPSAGIFYDFGDNLTASLGAGYYYQQIEDSDDQKGPFINTEINKLWQQQRWSIRTRGASGLDSQDFTAQSLGLTRYAQIELIPQYFFTRQFFTEGSLRYRYSDYINSDNDQIDHNYQASAGLGYIPLRWMTLRLQYDFNKLDSKNSLDDYENNRVLFSVTLEPDLPWRLK